MARSKSPSVDPVIADAVNEVSPSKNPYLNKDVQLRAVLRRP